jgi:hypothetical protein
MFDEFTPWRETATLDMPVLTITEVSAFRFQLLCFSSLKPET